MQSPDCLLIGYISYRRRWRLSFDDNYSAASGTVVGTINPGLKPRATDIECWICNKKLDKILRCYFMI
jgi:hypothetical protein